MSTKVYSFQDVVLSLSHPDIGSLTITGEGVGTVKVSMMSDRTTSEVAADGTTVMNKIRDRRGNLDLSLFATSDAHATLKKWYNKLEAAATNRWALMSATLTSNSTNESYKCSGVAFVKLPDGEYDASVKSPSWNLLCADVQNNII